MHVRMYMHSMHWNTSIRISTSTVGRAIGSQFLSAALYSLKPYRVKSAHQTVCCSFFFVYVFLFFLFDCFLLSFFLSFFLNFFLSSFLFFLCVYLSSFLLSVPFENVSSNRFSVWNCDFLTLARQKRLTLWDELNRFEINFISTETIAEIHTAIEDKDTNLT